MPFSRVVPGFCVLPYTGSHVVNTIRVLCLLADAIQIRLAMASNAGHLLQVPAVVVFARVGKATAASVDPEFPSAMAFVL